MHHSKTQHSERAANQPGPSTSVAPESSTHQCSYCSEVLPSRSSTSGTSTLKRPVGTEQRQQPTPPLGYGHQQSMHSSWMRWSLIQPRHCSGSRHQVHQAGGEPQEDIPPEQPQLDVPPPAASRFTAVDEDDESDNPPSPESTVDHKRIFLRNNPNWMSHHLLPADSQLSMGMTSLTIHRLPSLQWTTRGYSYVTIPIPWMSHHLLPADSQLSMGMTSLTIHRLLSLQWTLMPRSALPLPLLMTRPTLPPHQPMRLLQGVLLWRMCHLLSRTSSRRLLLEALMLAVHTRTRVLPPPGPHHHHAYPETKSSCQLSSELPWPGLMHYSRVSLTTLPSKLLRQTQQTRTLREWV